MPPSITSNNPSSTKRNNNLLFLNEPQFDAFDAFQECYLSQKQQKFDPDPI
jgi:hypothetical protein